MKFFIAILTFTILIISCNQTSSKKIDESNLKIYFNSQIKKYDSTLILQTFTFIKLDTTTLKNQYSQLLNGMLDKSEEYHTDINKLFEKVKLNRQLQSLSNDISPPLYKNFKGDADDDLKKANELISKDTILLKDIKKIDSILTTIDSLKPVSYLAKCFFVIKKSDQSISKDTAFIKLDLDYNIIDNEEYNKQLNRIYKPISDFKYQ